MEGTGVAKAQVVGGGSLFTTGLVMFVSGIVVLAADCSTVNKPWVLLVYGLVTMITYVWPMLAGVDRIQAARNGTECNKLIQGLVHIASLDGAYTWWFAGEIIRNYSNSQDSDGCEQGWDLLGLVLLSIRFVFLGIYVLFWIGVVIYFVCIKKK